MGQLRRLLRWLATPAATSQKQWSDGAYHCPKCGQELPATRPGSAAGTSPLGPMWLPRTPQELVAACPFDGHAPYNERARSMLAAGELPDTRGAGGIPRREG